MSAEEQFKELLEKMVEFGVKRELQMYEQSFHHLDRVKRKQRIRFIMRLSYALIEAEKISIQAIALAEGILCDVVIGDFKTAVSISRELRSDPDFVGLPKDSHLEPFFAIIEELASTLEQPDRTEQH